jgi:hypothetical protein
MPFTHPTLAIKNIKLRRFCIAEIESPVIAVNDWWVEANQHSTPAKRNSSLTYLHQKQIAGIGQVGLNAFYQRLCIGMAKWQGG